MLLYIYIEKKSLLILKTICLIIFLKVYFNLKSLNNFPKIRKQPLLHSKRKIKIRKEKEEVIKRLKIMLLSGDKNVDYFIKKCKNQCIINNYFNFDIDDELCKSI